METLLRINDHLSILVGLSCIAIGMAILIKTKLNRDAFFMVIYFFLLSLAVVLENRTVYLVFDSWAGNNSAWFVNSIAKTSAIWFVLLAIKPVVQLPRWLNRIFILTIAIYVALFVFIIRDNPQLPAHIVPFSNDFWEFSFLLISHIVNSVMCLLFAHLMLRLATQHTLILPRTRAILGAGISLLATVFFIVRALSSVAGYRSLSLSTFTALFAVSLVLAFLPGVVLLPMWYLPNRVLLNIVRPLLWLGDVLLVKDLRYLQSRLNMFCPPILNWQVNWLDVFRRPNLHTYQAVIDIFDRKTIISTYLVGLSSKQNSVVASVQNSYRLERWDKTTQEKAEELLKLLADVNDEAEFIEVAKAYQNLSLTLRNQ